MSVCVCVCVFTSEVPFKRLFAPTSRSRMSKNFRDSEFLRKSSVKKWSQIWTFVLKTGLKLPRRKKNHGFFSFAYWGTIWTFFCPHFPKLDVQNLRDSKSLGKNNGKQWGKIWTFFLKNGLKSPWRNIYMKIWVKCKINI